ATIEECQSEVDSLYKSLFGEDDYNSKEDKPILEPPLPQSDEIIIQKASSAVNGNKFKGLMDGDISGYETESEADLALCTILAFWTDNEDQIYRIIQKSKLYDEKWERLDYRKMTIGKAIDSAYGRHSNKYSSKAMKGVDVETRKEFKRTDMGNAERLVYHNGENIRYCNELNKWFIWNGKFWETDKTLKIYQIAKETVRKICNESANHNDTNKIELIEHANKSESQTRINAMVTLARSESEIAVTANQLDIDKWLLNCQNGTIDLRTKELSCHNREDLITKIVPVDYDPLAQCPQWLKFLNEIFSGNQDLIKYIQAIIGYSLTGDTTEQCFFILYGTGQNGKSTLLDTILYIMGDYGKQANPETFEDRKRSGNAASEDIARLCGIRFVSTIETGHSSGLAENLIKKMSGDSKITARELYKSSTEFEQTHKLFIATNHKPKILGNDYGIWRRIKLIPFEVTIPECQRDNKLLSKLQLEASGILSWIIEGCMIWQQEGLSNLIPEKVRRAIEDYKAEMDNVNLFIQQKCIMESNAKIQTSMLYEAYEKWCLSNGWQPSNIQQFSNRLKDLLPNIDKKRSGNRGENMWHGLKLSYGGGSL
ncbi:TPA: hypothetical protein ENS27_13190, partial [bacterium]|nr:hypothetical protein [bacterium]